MEPILGYHNTKLISIVGATPTMTTSISDVWDAAGLYAFPTAKMGMEAVSSDEKDTSNGTGARTIVIEYLTDAFAEKSETVTLNGTTAVALAANDIYRINRVYVATTGTGLAAAGNISVRHLGDTPVYGYILAAQNISRQAIYTVPAGKTLFISRFTAGFGESTAGSYTSAFITANQLDGAKTTLRYHQTRIFAGESTTVKYDTPICFVSGVDIVVSGLSSAAGICEVRLDGWIE